MTDNLENSEQKQTTNIVDIGIIKFLQNLDKGNFGTKDKILFFKELSYLLNGGISLVEAMRIISTSSDNYALKEIGKDISKFLHAGKPLSYALNRLPDYFDEGDYNVIKAGEASGNLAPILKSLAEEYVFMSDIKNKYISALIYPVILVIFAIVAVVVLFWFVLPEIFSIAADFDTVKMPRMTQVLKDMSDFLINRRQVILGVIGGIGLISSVFFSTDAGKKTWFSILLNIPLLGTMTKYFYLVKRCRYMKLMLGAGMNYVQTFQLLMAILGIPAYQDMLERVLLGLQRGETIYAGLKGETDLVPSDVSVMIKVGEESANLTNSVDNVLSMYEGELNILINRLAKVIEPIMLVFIGLVVVVIVLAIFGLILQIGEGVGL
ncbi:MAG: hypothetical protein CO170_01110 [candidate division SR1 bacterium CG_4_9_14_3_um_filter_40_9]|nr:MAG: hypothetical protein CO170_01110 [candidate division SR1 bacterium CG_4_9_14_3_um_filter_40_9]